VATASPGSSLLSELTSRARYGLTQGRVQKVDVDPEMGYPARVDLAKQLRPGLPAGAAERIGQRTATFADVFDVASAERLTELTGSDDEPGVLTVIDQLVNARAHRTVPSFAAVIIGWAGGMLHARQAERALDAVTGGPMGPDEHLVWAGSLVRLVDPAAPEIHAEIATLSLAHRRALAEAILDGAELIGGAMDSTIVDRVVAARAAHRVSADVTDKKRLLSLQAGLTLDLEELGDFGAALGIARAALHDTRLVPIGRQGQEAGRPRRGGDPAVHHRTAGRGRSAGASRGCPRGGRRCQCSPGGSGLGGGEPAQPARKARSGLAAGRDHCRGAAGP